MGSVMTCKLNPCCGNRRNCTPPPQYDHEYDRKKRLRIADALEKCDWSGCSIGNKTILRAAVEELRKGE